MPDAETITVNYKDNNDGPPIEYVLNAKSFEDLQAAADDLMNRLRSYEGVFNVVNDMESASEEVQFDLKPGAQAHDILERSVTQGLRLSKYEPIRPTLHEAFVTLVGEDVRQDMDLNERPSA